ncbi:MAG: hypothetical protein K6T31_11090, partial [Alicyclobacillus sp.]|nr:hypothetical protein [Alicyclobacillus sp.]
MSDAVTTVRPPSPAGELAERYAEPAWLTAWRDAAWQAFLDAPEPRLEKTDLSGRSWEVPLPPAQAGAVQAAAAELLLACADQPWLHIRDGHVVGLHLPEALRAQGVVWTDLHTAAREHASVLRPHLGQVVAPAESKWAALNAAAWRGGAFLYVPRGVAADAVFHLVYE